jgi:hypothetical protein
MKNWTTARSWMTFLVVVLVAALAGKPDAGAATNTRIALVVDKGEGQVITKCVAVAEEEITGYELLVRSGLTIDVDVQGGSVAVCSVDGTGCPSSDCFCQCKGGDDCVYWSYWHLVAGAWQYSTVGSSVYRASDGDVEGWAWGPGSVTNAFPPPLTSFDEVCASSLPPSSTPPPTATSTATPTLVVLPTPTTSDGQVDAYTPTSIPSPSATPAAPTPNPIETPAGPPAQDEPNPAIPVSTATIGPARDEATTPPGPVGGLSQTEETALRTPSPSPVDVVAVTPLASGPGGAVGVEAAEPAGAADAAQTPAPEPILAPASGDPQATATRQIIGQGQEIAAAAGPAPAAAAESGQRPEAPSGYLAFGAILVTLLILLFLARGRKRRLSS